MTRQRIAVVGAGTIGAHAMRVLAARDDIEVHGYDVHHPGHPHGAAGGEGRLMGSALGQPAEYDDLYARAFELWGELEREVRRPLRVFAGKLTIQSRADAEALFEHGTSRGERYELIDADTLQAAYPFQRYDGAWAVLDRNGGMIRSELAVRAAADVAVDNGAILRIGEEVLAVDEAGDGATVTTASGAERYDHVIVTPGAWARRFLPEVTAPVRVFRPVLAWFAPRDDAGLVGAIPFARSTPQFYGLPTLDGRLLRLGYGGPRQQAIEESPSPADYHVPSSDLGEFPEIVKSWFPGFYPEPVRVNAYFEGYVPDAKPIIRRLGGVTVAAGFSGNAFKFAPAYGELVADLASAGEVRPEGRFLVS